MNIEIFAAITAAGDSLRMGRPKALLPWGEETFLSAMLASLSQVDSIHAIAVVIGGDAEALAAEPRRRRAEILVNRHPEDGRFSSIKIAAHWALGRPEGTQGRRSLLLWPVDCPAVAPTTLARLGEESSRHPDANLVPAHGGRGGHPVVLCEAFLRTVSGAEKSANLRDLLRDGGVERRLCPVEDPAVLDNVNSPEEYSEFLKRRTPGSRTEEDDD